MDMAAKSQDLIVFHLTGKRSGAALQSVDAALRPAPLARFRDLDRLRYDYPAVLLDDPAQPDYVLSLTALTDRLLTQLAPRGIEGERMRRLTLRLEREVRALLADGEGGTVTRLWLRAAERLGEPTDLARTLVRATEALRADGEVVACDTALPARLVRQAWRAIAADKAREFRAATGRLIRQLSDILRAAHLHSAEGRRPEALRTAVGVLHADVFDFEAMSRLVARATPQEPLPPARRQRITRALETLRSQRFYPEPNDAAATGAAFKFEFPDCAAAAAAYRERLPRIVELLKAIAVAELEVAGTYREDEHDAVFERYDADSLTAADLAQFPDYLVCIAPERTNAPENAGLLGMLSAGLPLKVLVVSTDLLEDASIGTGEFAFGVRSTRLATAAMALGGMFVLQAAGSNLLALRERLRHGMRCREPALFSVFAGTPADSATLPPFLSAAAAMDARAFPAFSYDAAAGDNWATRFSLENNRDREADWPAESIEYADDQWQRASVACAFTFADFALTDRRHAHHYARIARGEWTDAMKPAAEWLALADARRAECVPFIWAVDAEDRLHRLIVDAKMMAATRRCLLLWRRLQEHAGINDPYAAALLERERAARAAVPPDATAGPESASTAAAAAQAAPAPAAPAAATAEAAAARSPDEAWIETSRCPSCNECQTINPQMFAYNENKQAYIKDITAGTYRQLVEAAEACQVAIIHPGKPRDPNEPGLAELIERAQPFL